MVPRLTPDSDQQGRARQSERQARREAEKQDDEDAPLEIDGERVGQRPARFCDSTGGIWRRGHAPLLARFELARHRRRNNVRFGWCQNIDFDLLNSLAPAFYFFNRDDCQPNVLV